MINELITKRGINVTERNDIKSIQNKLAQCEIRPLSKGQKSDILRFYQKVAGQSVPTLWHEYFFSRNDCFAVEYIPTSFYHKELIYRLNDHKLRHAYVDKGIYDLYFSDVNRPQTFVKNLNGYFYDESSPLTDNEAIERCKSISSAIVKPTQEGMWGQGVSVLSYENGMDENTVKSLFDKYGRNFIIQERVSQHIGLSELNPTSLNTIRVLSYRNGNEIFVLYAVVRIGRLGKTVDNETAGGINADIDLQTGKILDCAYGLPSEKRIYYTDNGTLLKGYTIPSFADVISLVKELHFRLPYFNLVGWDFGIDAGGKPILIEWNRCPDLSQTAHGPAFGEMTEMIIKDTMKRKDTRY